MDLSTTSAVEKANEGAQPSALVGALRSKCEQDSELEAAERACSGAGSEGQSLRGGSCKSRVGPAQRSEAT